MPKVTTGLYGDVALIPFQPAAPVKETIEFLTDIIVSVNGTEQPRKLRDAPRRTIEYTMPLQVLDDPQIFNLLYGGLRGKFIVPKWAEGQEVGNLTSSATIACDTLVHELFVGTLALIYTSAVLWQVIEITAKTDTSVTASGAITPQNNAYLIPLRMGYVDGSPRRSSTGNSTAFSVNFEFEEPLVVTPAAPEQYLTYDIYYDPPLTDSGYLQTTLEKQYDKIDFDIGLAARRTQWLNTRYGVQYAAIGDGPTESYTFTKFLYRRLGRFRRFWMPTFENNMRTKNVGTIATTLTVWRDSIPDYASARVHVAFEVGGVWYPRLLTAPTILDGTTVQFTLSSALGLPAESVNRLSYLGLYRLDADTIELNWIGNRVLQSAVRIVEIAP